MDSGMTPKQKNHASRRRHGNFCSRAAPFASRTKTWARSSIKVTLTSNRDGESGSSLRSSVPENSKCNQNNFTPRARPRPSKPEGTSWATRPTTMRSAPGTEMGSWSGLVQLNLPSNGKSSKRSQPLVPLFDLPESVRYVRLLFLTRASQTEHDQAILGSSSLADLDGCGSEWKRAQPKTAKSSPRESAHGCPPESLFNQKKGFPRVAKLDPSHLIFVALACGIGAWFLTGVDFPESNRRFARLT